MIPRTASGSLPGSVSIPKENSAHSYMVYEDGLFVWKNLVDGKAYDEFSI